MMMFISNGKKYMFGPIAAIFRFDNFLAKRVLYNISILYKTLLARKLSNLKMAAIGRNM